MDLIDIILNIDVYLTQVVNNYGILSYVLISLVIFAETGLVFTPFLPGDSLIFAAGSIAAISSLNIFVLFFILFLAAFLGDTANYFIGEFFGKKISGKINQKYLQRTEEFYQKHGGMTIFLARFVPIVRTFAPFVAGLGKMNYRKFISYNATGGAVWVALFLFSGYFLGNISQVKENFSIVIMAIILISITPILFEFIKNRKSK
ncbi:MAG: VTT domain-containing protein [Candidatus Pacebacteria bacterium]|nr:VTT domain-containing protein [Candidatus Paceibacterota bacterium]